MLGPAVAVSCIVVVRGGRIIGTYAGWVEASEDHEKGRFSLHLPLSVEGLEKEAGTKKKEPPKKEARLGQLEACFFGTQKQNRSS